MKKFLSSPIATVVLFAFAALLIGFGAINAIQAAPRIESSDYRAQVQLTNINVALTENGDVKSNDDELLTQLSGKDFNFKIGDTYDEKLAVRNTKRPDSTNEGEGIDEYVRVTVYRYWTNGNGKAVNLNPDYIELNFLTGNGWEEDTEASTAERKVFYYKDKLPVGDETAPFADKITINKAVATEISNGKYSYDDVSFHVKVTVDAVQTHNGTEAMKSAWGRTNE